MVEFGYNNRKASWNVYLTIIILLFIFYYLLVRQKKSFISPFKLSLFVGGIMLFSYPFLSHDFFSYIFYARIATFYYKNPYGYMAGDFYLDPWLRFTQWTGNNYPYGPIFLLLTLIPSFLGFGKFLPTFIFFKIMTIGFYLLTVFFLQKISKKAAFVYATNPLIIIEGLINGHNDLIALSFVITGVYFFIKKKNILSMFFLSLSIGIKFITLPFVTIYNKLRLGKFLILTSIILTLVLIIIKTEIQPWYFMMLFGLLVFYPTIIDKLSIFFFGMLVSYFPYVRYGGWGKVLYWTTDQKLEAKHKIIIIFALVNLIYLLVIYFSKNGKKNLKFFKV